eukprot:CAMPEP_0115310996 /NCGR_PEP_ID=MMETSP0270-20121206/75098_1 /TAXON_ID=71861 /ORGANISM="Scrippsiella trochoidea, Strain CCMP3099" /LENGTH=140 /DNA_ID=CAMNT_0002729795 /DNA_START=309 /DNA_END=732 /DNA_ORIENTATION=-
MQCAEQHPESRPHIQGLDTEDLRPNTISGQDAVANDQCHVLKLVRLSSTKPTLRIQVLDDLCCDDRGEERHAQLPHASGGGEATFQDLTGNLAAKVLLGIPLEAMLQECHKSLIEKLAQLQSMRKQAKACTSKHIIAKKQ